jgi:hypothetical protein
MRKNIMEALMLSTVNKARFIKEECYGIYVDSIDHENSTMKLVATDAHCIQVLVIRKGMMLDYIKFAKENGLPDFKDLKAGMVLITEKKIKKFKLSKNPTISIFNNWQGMIPLRDNLTSDIALRGWFDGDLINRMTKAVSIYNNDDMFFIPNCWDSSYGIHLRTYHFDYYDVLIGVMPLSNNITKFDEDTFNSIMN